MITDGVQAEKVPPLSPVEMLVVVPMDDEKGKQLPISHVKPPIQKKHRKGEINNAKAGSRPKRRQDQ
jgi:hypothetical protein